MTNDMAQLMILLDVRARLIELMEDLVESEDDLLYDPAQALEELVLLVEDAIGCNSETAAPSTQLGGGNHD